MNGKLSAWLSRRRPIFDRLAIVATLVYLVLTLIDRELAQALAIGYIVLIATVIAGDLGGMADEK